MHLVRKPDSQKTQTGIDGKRSVKPNRMSGWSCLIVVILTCFPLNTLNGQDDETSISPEAAKQLGRMLDREWKDKPEWAEMAADILKGTPMSPVSGWFKPTQTPFDGRYAMNRYDRNGDRQIELDEFGGPEMQKYFDRLDRDRNGVLNRIDFDWSISNPINQQAKPVEKIFEQWDRDANGKLTEEEIVGFFNASDPEKSGFLTQEDLRIAFALMLQDNAAPEQNNSEQETKVEGESKPSVEPDLLAMLFNEELGNLTEGPDVGDTAPDFELPYLKQEGTLKLSSLRGKKIVVLNFGSFT